VFSSDNKQLNKVFSESLISPQMRKTIDDRYSTRLKAAMEANDCSPRELARACGCTEERIKGACKEGNDTPLGTDFHFRAAFYLRQDPMQLYTGDLLPIRPELEGPVKNTPRQWYQESSHQAKDAFHALLKQAVDDLEEPMPKRRQATV
jgi:hypothetical protein